MSEGPDDDAPARKEAEAWVSRLSHLSVTTQTLQEFRAWGRSSENARAYAEVEGRRRAGRLPNDPDLRQATGEAPEASAPQVLPSAKSGRRGGRHVALVCAVSLGVVLVAALVQRSRATGR